MAKNRFNKSPQVPVGAFATAARLIVEGARMEANALGNLGAQIGGGISRKRERDRQDGIRQERTDLEASRHKEKIGRLDTALGLEATRHEEDVKRDDDRFNRTQTRLEGSLELRRDELKFNRGAPERAQGRALDSVSDLTGSIKRGRNQDAILSVAGKVKEFQDFHLAFLAKQDATPEDVQKYRQFIQGDPIAGPAIQALSEGRNPASDALKEVEVSPGELRAQNAKIESNIARLSQSLKSITDGAMRRQIGGQITVLRGEMERNVTRAKTAQDAIDDREFQADVVSIKGTLETRIANPEWRKTISDEIDHIAKSGDIDSDDVRRFVSDRIKELTARANAAAKITSDDATRTARLNAAKKSAAATKAAADLADDREDDKAEAAKLKDLTDRFDKESGFWGQKYENSDEIVKEAWGNYSDDDLETLKVKRPGWARKIDGEILFREKRPALEAAMMEKHGRLPNEDELERFRERLQGGK